MSAVDQYRQVMDLFFVPGEVVEIRAFDLQGKNKAWDGWSRGSVFGYFDDPERFAEGAASLNAAGAGSVFYTANPCNPDLLARANNRLIAHDNKRPSTSNPNIACIRWLLIDLDPQRPGGISSSNSELEATQLVARSIVHYLENRHGWPKGVQALSGNGHHIMYRMPDLINEDHISGSNGLVHRVLKNLATKFNTPLVEVDQVVYNAARVWKLYGTWARKGDSTELRPHRQSKIYPVDGRSSLDDIAIVTMEQLQAVALPEVEKKPAQLPARTHTPKYNKASATNPCNQQSGPGRFVKGREYLDDHGVKVTAVLEEGELTRFCFDQCLFDESHIGHKSCAIVISSSPPFITYHCYHNTCNYTWQDAKAKLSGKKSLAQYCENYDPNWQPPAGRRPAPTPREQLSPLEVVVQVVDGAAEEENPVEVSPYRFFSEGKRPAFILDEMARYVSAYLHPLVHTDGDYWHYASGVWSVLNRKEIGKVVAVALKDQMSTSRIENTVMAISYTANLEEERWQPPEHLINLRNGMVNFRENKLQDHDHMYFSRVQVPFAYDPEARCPQWDQAVMDIFDNNTAKVLLLQEFMGYIFMPTSRFEKCLFMFGTGANGKSTILRVVEELVGHMHVSALSLSAFSERFGLFVLRDKLVNISSEVDAKDPSGTENLKKAISGDLISSDKKFGEAVTFRTTCKFLFAMNSPPAISDKTYGFARKVMILNFDRRFSEEEMDKELIGKLLTELPGIFNWALDGARRLLEQETFTTDDGIKEDTEKFMSSMNPVLIFLEEICLVQESAKVATADLFNEYKKWCDETLHRPMGRVRFYEQIVCLPGVKKTRPRIGGSRKNYFTGLGLVTDQNSGMPLGADNDSEYAA